MELPEPIEKLNYRLDKEYGRKTDISKPDWRIVFSDDQYEKRRTSYTDSGVELLTPEIRELPKYKQWIQGKWILERNFPVPAINMHELTTKTSYECIWVFEDEHKNPLPPIWDAIKFIIETVLAQSAKTVGAKYIDPSLTVEGAREEKRKRVEKIHRELFGNESDLATQLAHGEGVSLSGPEFKGEDQPKENCHGK